MYAKNEEAVLPFALVSKSNGSAITSGTASGYAVLDGGAQVALTNTPVHEGNGQWSVALTASEMNADSVGVLLTHADAIPVHYAISTSAGLVAMVANAVSDQADIAALIAAWVDGGRLDTILDTINSKAGLITASSVSVVSPVAADGTTITVVQGDDYSGSRAITWTGSSEDQWPDLTDATLAFRATMMGALPVEATPTVTTPTGTQVFTMSLTDTHTDTPIGRYRYDVEATLSGGDVVTLLRGAFVVQRTYTNEP